MRKPRVKFLLPERRTALMVCHAMSMAMTVVLPAPVASLSARRISSGLASLLTSFEVLQDALAGFDDGAHLGQPDRRLDGFDLTEEGAHAAELVMPPVLQQACCFRRDLPVVGAAELRHVPTCPRISLMREVGSYCCSFVERPLPSSKTISSCAAEPFASSAWGSA